ncbi:putative ABC transporter type IV [Kineothrix alysoides]|jgi:uncharacterized membrane protein|uniref:Putative ABC transporter type IV n=1 Tax=Kineothrix alysoides TaxID=1469948 RepID=A0A4R1R4Y2_9FIRM|nr:putative ABC transporter permease [Kineothrix alysoides]TCL60470.1 putative ABC transporter type IV [Kineothrix alysoides]
MDRKISYAELIRQKRNETYGFFFYTPLFFLLSFAGWLWEVLIYMGMEGEFVNRGVLFGPWLPIYGTGGIILSFVLGRYEYKPVRVFFISMLLCSVLEYLASWILERTWGIRWWDYSNDFLNISGRICLWGSLMFGLSGWMLICYIIPYMRLLYRKIWKTENGRKLLQLICLALILLFTADATFAADFPNMGKSISYESPS